MSVANHYCGIVKKHCYGLESVVRSCRRDCLDPEENIDITIRNEQCLGEDRQVFVRGVFKVAWRSSPEQCLQILETVWNWYVWNILDMFWGPWETSKFPEVHVPLNTSACNIATTAHPQQAGMSPWKHADLVELENMMWNQHINKATATTTIYNNYYTATATTAVTSTVTTTAITATMTTAATLPFWWFSWEDGRELKWWFDIFLIKPSIYKMAV